MYKYPFLLFLLCHLSFSSKGQGIHAVTDSVFAAVKMEDAERLKNLCPGYKDLKALYDTSNVDMLNYQIGVRQKELEYLTRKDMKALVKFAKSENYRLGQLEKTEVNIDSQRTEMGHSYAHIRLHCEAYKRPYILYFTLIRFDTDWFYGEGLRIEKVEVVKEDVPNYEQIDQERERKRIEREKEKQALIEAEKKRLEDSVKREEKQAIEKKKEEERIQKQKEKEEREEKKRQADSIKVQEKLAIEKKKEEERLQKEKEKEEKAKQKEAERKAKEEALKQKKEQKKKEAEERERQLKEKKKQKKKEEKKAKKKKEEEEKKRKEEEKRLKEEKEKNGG